MVGFEFRGKAMWFQSLMSALRLRPQPQAWIVASVCAVSLVGCNASSSGDQNPLGLSQSAKTKTNSGGVGGRFKDLEIVSTLPAPDNTNNGSKQPISANDLLEVDVFQVDELDKTVRVDASGRISLPLIGSVVVAGKSVDQVERTLEQRYGANYLQSPEISVFVKEASGMRVTMDGQFKRPGIFPTTTNSTLLQAVAQAGGITDLADEGKLYVFRTHRNKKLVANYSLKDIRSGSKADPRLFGGDVVVAFTSNTKVAAKNLREVLGLATSAGRLVSPL